MYQLVIACSMVAVTKFALNYNYIHGEGTVRLNSVSFGANSLPTITYVFRTRHLIQNTTSHTIQFLKFISIKGLHLRYLYLKFDSIFAFFF